MSPPRIDTVPFEVQPDVVLLMVALGAGYLWALRSLGPRVAPDEVTQRRRPVLFFTGLLVLTVAASWPIDTIGDGYLFSVHMGQYLLMTLVAAPLLLAGVPGWLLRELTVPIRPAVAWLARPLVALLILNTILVVSHWPVLIEIYVTNDVVHFAMHVLWVGSGLLFWMPILSPIPEYPRLSEPLQMGYLFLSSVIPTFPASFLTWADGPFYDVYAEAPRLWGISAITDTQAAGLVMKLGGGILLWSVITVIFFRWVATQTDPSADSNPPSRIRPNNGAPLQHR